MIRLRQIVDVHYRSAEIEGLLSELDEVDSSSDEDSDAMEWSISEGQPPRTKVIALIMVLTTSQMSSGMSKIL